MVCFVIPNFIILYGLVSNVMTDMDSVVISINVCPVPIHASLATWHSISHVSLSRIILSIHSHQYLFVHTILIFEPNNAYKIAVLVL
jgi:hypothetical protein